MGRLLLVRHGQASFGAADYDVLSATGERQSAVLGERLKDLAPDLVVHGTLQRQRRTAEEMVAAAGWATTPQADPGWDEFDHLGVLSREQRRDDHQDWFEAAVDRWMEGAHDHEYDETFAGFTARVAASAAAALDAGGLVVVVSSGGPISWVAAGLLDGGIPTYRRLTRVVVNTAVTTVVRGRRGTNLLTFNEHSHLPPDLVTYR